MPNKLPTTGYTADSPNNFGVGAGIVVHDFKYDKTTSEYTFQSFGATSGGNTVELTNSLRQMEIDGVLSTPAGGDIIEEAEGTIELNLLEVTLENIKKLLIGRVGSDETPYAPAGTEYVKPKGRVELTDYLRGFAHLSPLSNGDVLAIIFDYAIPTEGFTWEPQDAEDNTMTATFAARNDPNNLQDAALPVTIMRLPAKPQGA